MQENFVTNNNITNDGGDATGIYLIVTGNVDHSAILDIAAITNNNYLITTIVTSPITTTISSM